MHAFFFRKLLKSKQDPSNINTTSFFHKHKLSKKVKCPSPVISVTPGCQVVGVRHGDEWWTHFFHARTLLRSNIFAYGVYLRPFANLVLGGGSEIVNLRLQIQVHAKKLNFVYESWVCPSELAHDSNRDTSSLLSEPTPTFKDHQKRTEPIKAIFKSDITCNFLVLSVSYKPLNFIRGIQ